MKTRVSLKYFANYYRLRGTKKRSVNVDNHTDGVEPIHTPNMKKHIKAGGLHDWGSKKYRVAVHFQPLMLVSLAQLKRATHQIKAESKTNFEIPKFMYVEND